MLGKYKRFPPTKQNVMSPLFCELYQGVQEEITSFPMFKSKRQYLENDNSVCYEILITTLAR